MPLAFFVLTQYRRVTDGQTDGQTDRHVAIIITRIIACENIVRLVRVAQKSSAW